MKFIRYSRFVVDHFACIDRQNLTKSDWLIFRWHRFFSFISNSESSGCVACASCSFIILAVGVMYCTVLSPLQGARVPFQLHVNSKTLVLCPCCVKPSLRMGSELPKAGHKKHMPYIWLYHNQIMFFAFTSGIHISDFIATCPKLRFTFLFKVSLNSVFRLQIKCKF